jgi:hypothetical protein
MRSSNFARLGLVVAAPLFATMACGGDAPPGPEFTSSGSSGTSGTSGTSGSSGSSGILPTDTDGGDGGGGDGSSVCAATVAGVEKPPVDIIFVIDNSGSMTAEMTQIRTNINSFATKIGTSGLDYRVVMVTLKAAKPNVTGLALCVNTPLGGANCTDNLPTFRHVNQEIDSFNALRQLLATYDSSNAQLAWKGNLRPEAYKVFIAVTDDQSSLPSADFDTQLLAKAPAGMFGTAANRKYIFHSIVGWKTGTPVNSATNCTGSVNTGSRYQELSILTKGIVGSICEADYGPVLNKLADGITNRLACQLKVPTAASSNPETMIVQYGKAGAAPSNLTRVTDVSKCATIADGWYFDNNAAPTQIVLCPTACTTVTAVAGAKVSALVGCAAPPPR